MCLWVIYYLQNVSSLWVGFAGRSVIKTRAARKSPPQRPRPIRRICNKKVRGVRGEARRRENSWTWKPFSWLLSCRCAESLSSSLPMRSKRMSKRPKCSFFFFSITWSYVLNSNVTYLKTTQCPKSAPFIRPPGLLLSPELCQTTSSAFTYISVYSELGAVNPPT